jgi:hypothetical protein
MMQEIIKNFWQISGLKGIAIWDSNSQLLLFTKRRIPDWEKEAITQIIGKNLYEYAQKLEQSKFKVMGDYAHTYIEFPWPPIVILTQTHVFDDNQVTNLKLAIKTDYQQAIAILEDLVKAELAQPVKKFNTYKSQAGTSTVTPITKETSTVTPITKETSTVTPIRQPSSTITSNPAISLDRITDEPVTIQELINALNQFNSFCSKYMGQTMTLKYLEKSRPQDDWLASFKFTKTAQVMFVGNLQQKLTTDQKLLVKQWIKDFLGNSRTVFAQLPTMLQQSDLNDKQKLLLLAYSQSW